MNKAGVKKAYEAQYKKDIHNVYFPEWDKVEEIAASESGKRKKPIRTGTMMREIAEKVFEIWKKKGQLPW